MTRWHDERGQIAVIVAVAMVVLVAMVGLVVDGSNGWAQRRAVQNAADFAALAGSRIVALYVADAANGAPNPNADADVAKAIQDSLQTNRLPTATCTATLTTNCYTAIYVDGNGKPTASAVGDGVFPQDARGVQVTPTRSFETYFIRVIGLASASASASSTARASFYDGAVGESGPPMLPIGVTVNQQTWATYFCAASKPASQCTSLDLQTFNPKQKGAPGQFGWLSWNGTTSTPYLCKILGPPAQSPTYTIPAYNYITIPGNSGVSSSNCVKTGIGSWTSSMATVLLPVISPGPPAQGQNCTTAPDHCWPNGKPYPPSTVKTNGGGNNQGGGNNEDDEGGNVSYNIIGFVGFQLTGCGSPCIKHVEGVFRQAIFLGPTGANPANPGTPGAAQAIQLVR